MIDELIVLNIDDDAEDTEIFCDAIASLDLTIKCVVAESGPAALKLLKTKECCPDIIFLDQNMPEMTGKQVLTALQNIDHLSNVPIVMHSTTFSEDDQKYFTDRNVHLLLKQNSFQQTVKKIGEVISRLRPQ